MGVRCSVRFPLFVALMAGILAGVFWSLPGASADPDNYDNSSSCDSATVCGDVCFYANCVECTICPKTCYRSCFIDEPCPPPDDPDDPGDPDQVCGYWSSCPYDCPYPCAPCKDWRWHMGGGNQSQDIEFYAENFATALDFVESDLPIYHCRDQDGNVSEAGPISRPGSITDEDLEGPPVEENLVQGMPVPRAGEPIVIRHYGGVGSSPPLGLPSVLHSYAGEPGGPSLDSVVLLDFPEYELHVSGHGGETLLYRFWSRTGGPPQDSNDPNDSIKSVMPFLPAPITHPASVFKVLLPLDEPAIYSFQLAFLEAEGDPARFSNVIDLYAGFEWTMDNSLPVIPSATPGGFSPWGSQLRLVAPGGTLGWKETDYSPAPTPLPTPLPGESARPQSPSIVEVVRGAVDPDAVDPDAVDPSRVTVTVAVRLSGNYSGRLEYRAYHFTGFRIQEHFVPWIPIYVPSGAPGEFEIAGLEVPFTWEFEVRAVDGGVLGNPSPPYLLDLWAPFIIPYLLDFCDPAALPHPLDLWNPATIPYLLNLWDPATIADPLDLWNPATIPYLLNFLDPATVTGPLELWNPDPATIIHLFDLWGDAVIADPLDLWDPATIIYLSNLWEVATITDLLNLCDPAVIADLLELLEP